MCEGRAGMGQPEQTSEKRALERKDNEHTFKLDYLNVNYIYHRCEFFQLKSIVKFRKH